MSDLLLDYIIITQGRNKEFQVVDASFDFYNNDLITELWAEDNGIIIPELPAEIAMYRVTDITVRMIYEDEAEISGTWTKIASA